MRLNKVKSKNAISYYIIRSVRRNGKNSSEIVKKLGTEITSDNIDDLINIIENAGKYANIQEVKDFAWQKQGQGAKNTVDFLVKKQLELSKNDRISV